MITRACLKRNWRGSQGGLSYLTLGMESGIHGENDDRGGVKLTPLEWPEQGKDDAPRALVVSGKVRGFSGWVRDGAAQSGRGLPHSKTLREIREAAWLRIIAAPGTGALRGQWPDALDERNWIRCCVPSAAVSAILARMKPVTYVAFLRGINVVGNTMVRMDDLKKAFASLGFTKIRTVLASGNVVFETLKADQAVLTRKIEQKLQSTFGLEIAVMIRTAPAIQALIASKPFRKARLTAKTKCHVTFLSPDSESGLRISQRLQEKDFESFRESEGEVCSTVEISAVRGTSDLMKMLEKQFGRRITTRTWNTVERIGRILEN